MDLRTNQQTMGVQDRYSSVYETQLFNVEETYKETDIKGNNNLFNFLKTETNTNYNSDSLEVKCSNNKKLEVDNSLFSYSSFKKAMDLRTHNRTVDGERRSIFDDAEYFSKNYCYKLLPITFEQVDESIIQSEHNYSLFSLTSESEAEEDCSRMMDYSQIKKKNYKRRRTKFREDGDVKEETIEETLLPPMLSKQNEEFSAAKEHSNVSDGAQPLDLSAAPLVQDEKTDPPLREKNLRECVPSDSDKENLNSELNGIRVTITRPDEKENYTPCDLFLNDIARLVPWLIDKDCLEVDILDKTCDGQDEFRKHRLYYVISESTWRMFQRTKERVILTNDQSLGQPLRKAEKVERPSYMVFDQFSLVKCLAEYCEEIGGCFEYTCVEEGKEEDFSDEKGTKEIEEESMIELKKVEEAVEKNETEEEGKKEEETSRVEEEQESISKTEEKKVETSEEVIRQTKETPEKVEATSFAEAEEKVSSVKKIEESESQKGEEKEEKKKVKKKKMLESKKTKKKLNTNSTVQTKERMATRSKSTSESETSQKSDKRKNQKERRKRGGEGDLVKEEPPTKLKKVPGPEYSSRMTRSGKVLREPKKSKPTGKEKGKKRGTEERGEGTGRALRSQKVQQGRGRERTSASASKSKGGRR